MTDTPAILLVHGAWHGSWCWDDLARVLRQRGWRVETVDLPTVWADPPTGVHMQDDADEVARAIDAIEGPVVVVAHSYGGVPVTQAAVSEAVRCIVYVSAFALDEGESLLGAVGGEPPSWWVIDGALVTAGTDEEPPAGLFFNDVPEAEAAPLVARLRPQSVLAFQEPLTRAAWRSKPSTYVVTERDGATPVQVQEALAARAGSTVRRMDTSHSPFVSRPDELADIIEEAARG